VRAVGLPHRGVRVTFHIRKCEIKDRKMKLKTVFFLFRS
jgi:hypothetical protein